MPIDTCLCFVVISSDKPATRLCTRRFSTLSGRSVVSSRGLMCFRDRYETAPSSLHMAHQLFCAVPTKLDST